MASLATGDVVRVKIACTCRNQLALNVLHYQCTLSSGSVTTADCATRIDQVVEPQMKPLLSVNAQYYGVNVQLIDPVAAAADTEAGNAGAGTATGDVLPLQVCGIITKRSALLGRKHRGRMYIPFPSEADNDSNGVPSSTYFTNLAVLAAVVLAPITVSPGGGTLTLFPCIYHKGQVPLTDILIGWTRRQRWATQRRRGDFGRPNSLPPFAD